MVDHGTLAQQLYEAYAEDADWAAYDGSRLPVWEFVAERIQNHWTAVARKAAGLLI